MAEVPLDAKEKMRDSPNPIPAATHSIKISVVGCTGDLLSERSAHTRARATSCRALRVTASY